MSKIERLDLTFGKHEGSSSSSKKHSNDLLEIYMGFAINNSEPDKDLITVYLDKDYGEQQFTFYDNCTEFIVVRDLVKTESWEMVVKYCISLLDASQLKDLFQLILEKGIGYGGKGAQHKMRKALGL